MQAMGIALMPAHSRELLRGFSGIRRTGAFLANLTLPDGRAYERVPVKALDDEACAGEWCLGLPILADYDLRLPSDRIAGSHMTRPKP